MDVFLKNQFVLYSVCVCVGGGGGVFFFCFNKKNLIKTHFFQKEEFFYLTKLLYSSHSVAVFTILGAVKRGILILQAISSPFCSADLQYIRR